MDETKGRIIDLEGYDIRLTDKGWAVLELKALPGSSITKDPKGPSPLRALYPAILEGEIFTEYVRETTQRMIWREPTG